MIRCLLFCAIAGAALLHKAIAADWPQLLGPNRDGNYSGNDLAAAWPKDGPPVVWKMKIGQGFAAPSVADGKLILFHRVDDRERVEALDARTGKPLWKFDYPATYKDDFGFDPGPRATPTVSGGKVFTYGADGMLLCVKLADGAKLWSVDCKKDFGSPKGFFGRACSPLVEGQAVIVNVGGPGAGGATAFDKDTGKTLWKQGSDEASYSSPVAASFGTRRAVLMVSRGQFTGLDAANGQTVFAAEFRPPVHASVTGALPVVVSNQIFISAAYDLGAIQFRVAGDKLERVWGGDAQLSLQFTTAVHRDGFLFGLHGRHDFPGGTELRCVEFATGKVRWSKPGLGGANVILAGDSLLMLTENGELIRIAAKPDVYRELARVQILGRGVRAYPALANGLFYARDKGQLICVDLRAN